MSARTLVLRLHRWGGLATGVVVVLLSLTGAILLISMPADSAALGRVGVPERADTPMLAPSRLVELARDVGDGELPRSLEIRFSNPRRADVSLRDDQLVSLDPWTGAVLRAFRHETSFSGQMERLHTHLMLGGLGQITVELTTVLFVLLVLFGIWLWWPTRRTVRRSFMIEWRRGFKRANYDLHNVLGFYSSVLLLILGGTGVLLAFPQLQQFGARAIGAVGGGGESGGRGGSGPDASGLWSIESAGQAPPIMDQVWRGVRSAYPASPWQRMNFNGPEPFAYRVQVGAGEPDEMFRFHTVRANRDGESTGVVAASEEPLAGRLSRLVGRLHTGSINGPYRVASFIACVIGVVLPITGAIVWYPRWKRRRAGQSPPEDDPGPDPGGVRVSD